MTAVVAPTLRAHLQYAASVAFTWVNPSNMPSRHAHRTARVRTMWPDLAALLDGLVESLPDADETTTVIANTCPACSGPAARLKVAPDPRTAIQVCKVEPCGHEIDREVGIEMRWAGVPTDVTPVDGATLVGAEVRAQREAGHSVEADQAHDPGDLAWAAWCVLDRVGSDSTDVPAMWPWDASRWKAYPDRLRALTVAGALIAAEIDRELATQRAQERAS
jgi:hypothetical protein